MDSFSLKENILKENRPVVETPFSRVFTVPSFGFGHLKIFQIPLVYQEKVNLVEFTHENSLLEK